MTLLGRLWRLARTSWKRNVTASPDRYQAYLSFPTDAGHSRADAVASHIADLEFAFEGAIDVYARPDGLAAVSDAVPADRFDPATFETVLDEIEETFAATHSLAAIEKWRRLEGSLVKSYVVVPVKPLFSERPPTEPRRRAAPAESSVPR